MHPNRLLRYLDLTTLQLLLSIHEEGTLTGGARREAIAVSAASKRLFELEQAIGMPLFVRKAKGMEVTVSGESMLNYAREILLGAQRIGVELAEQAQHARSHVRIVANLSAIVEFLPEDLSEFFRLHKTVKVDLQERTSEGVLRAIEDGTADLGICADKCESHGLYCKHYRRDRLVLVMRDTHRLARHKRIAFAESLDADHIGLHVDSWINARMHLASIEAGKPLNIQIRVPEFHALCRMAQAGIGIGLIPYKVFVSIGKPLGLAAVELDDEWACRDLQVVVGDPRQLSPAAAALFYQLTTKLDSAVKPPLRLHAVALHAM